MASPKQMTARGSQGKPTSSTNKTSTGPKNSTSKGVNYNTMTVGSPGVNMPKPGAPRSPSRKYPGGPDSKIKNNMGKTLMKMPGAGSKPKGGKKTPTAGH